MSGLLSVKDAGTTTWEQRAEAKRKSCRESIPTEWRLPQSVWDSLPLPLEKNKVDLIATDIPRSSGILSDRELDLTESLTVPELLSGLATGKISSLELTIAYSKRAAIAQQLTQCLTETMFAEAQARATFLDDLRSKGRLAGPLHGLPISIKDGFQVKGTQATIGLVSNIDKYSEIDSPLVTMLLKLGAVVYVKTNIPQTLMNHIFGRTLNPSNTCLTAGGSSGGEGALIAFRGSPLGVGTDIAGSVRIPAYCCGTYGFKPTTARIPYGGQASCANPGLRTITPCAGPLANDVEALGLFLKGVIGADPSMYDETSIHAPWRTEATVEKPKLRLGLVREDPVFPLQPPVKKALDEAVGLLKEAGHEIIELSSEEAGVNALVEVGWTLLTIDDTAERVAQSSGEPLIESILRIRDEVTTLPWTLKQQHQSLPDLERLAEFNIQRARLQQRWHGLWRKYGLDAVISPPSRSTALEHDGFGLPPYTLFVNVLDYPAAVLPLGRVASEADNPEFQPRAGQPKYNPAVLQGAPLSIQVFTERMRDEECLGAARTLDRVLAPLRR